MRLKRVIQRKEQLKNEHNELIQVIIEKSSSICLLYQLAALHHI